MSIFETLRKDEPPSELYHYTTQKGLLGICNTKSIRTTKVLCLNDSSEYVLALKLEKEILTEFEEAGIYDPQNIVLLREAIRTIRHLNIFVSSFTEDGDLLSQWRAYGNSSGGYSIGFDGQKLAKEAKKQRYFLAKCIYDPKKQKKVLSSMLKEYLSKDYDFSEKHKVKHGKFLYLTFENSLIWEDLASFAPIIKSKGFEAENEWRLISEGPKSASDAEYRSGQSYIVPYFDFTLENPVDFIKSITIGPTPHPEISEDTLKMLLIKQDVNNKIEIKHTNIPYRNW